MDHPARAALVRAGKNLLVAVAYFNRRSFSEGGSEGDPRPPKHSEGGDAMKL